MIMDMCHIYMTMFVITAFFIVLLASGDLLGMLGGVFLKLLAQRILGSFQQLLRRNLIYFKVLSA